MPGYYQHMGYQQAWSYKKVLEFYVSDGKIIYILDYSDKVEALRKEIDENPEKIEKYQSDPARYVYNSFSKDYEDKAWWIDEYKDIKPKIVYCCDKETRERLKEIIEDKDNGKE